MRMLRYALLPLTMLGAGIVTYFIAASLEDRRPAEPSARAPIAQQVSRAREAAAYSCGYIGGLYAAMKRLPTLFSESQLPPKDSDGCAAYRANAIGHGFSTAKED